MSKPTNPPQPRATVTKCPTCGQPAIRWPDGEQKCTRDHSTAQQVIDANEKRGKR